MEEKENKSGLTVKELEGFAKKYRIEVFLCLLFFLAGVFGLLLWGAAWNILLAMIGGIIGTLIPAKVRHMSHAIWGFAFRQDRTTQIIIAAITLVLAIFVSPLFFLFIGLHAGKSMHMSALKTMSGDKP